MLSRTGGKRRSTRQRRLDHRSNEARTLFATAWALFEAGHWAGRPVRLIGLGMADLGTPDPIQPDLFEGGAERPADSDRDRRLTTTIDRIQARFGSGALRQGMPTGDREPAYD